MKQEDEEIACVAAQISDEKAEVGVATTSDTAPISTETRTQQSAPQDKPSTSTARNKRKHRHDSDSDELLPLHPKDFLNLGLYQSDLEENTSPEEEEPYDDYEKWKGTGKKARKRPVVETSDESSYDNASTDHSVQEDKLRPGKDDSLDDSTKEEDDGVIASTEAKQRLALASQAKEKSVRKKRTSNKPTSTRKPPAKKARAAPSCNGGRKKTD